MGKQVYYCNSKYIIASIRTSNIFVITQVRGEAKDTDDNYDIVRLSWGITGLYPIEQSPVWVIFVR